jgi:hypothetical protein
MADNLISVRDFAEANGLIPQTVFKVLKRHGIEPRKSRGGGKHRGQFIAYISEQKGRAVLEALASPERAADSASLNGTEILEASLYDVGVFYLLHLEPEHDPNRFKVGFASNLDERLRQHKCSAPFAKVVKTWPCRRLWERTAIECVTEGCDRLHTEVFRSSSIAAVEAKCSQFFALMPRLATHMSPSNATKSS